MSRTDDTDEEGFTVERWMAYIWAEATRNDNDVFRSEDAAVEAGFDGQVAPPTFGYYLARAASEVGIEAVAEATSSEVDWEGGIYWGEQTLEFHRPLVVGETYRVTDAEITDVEHKAGSSGEFDVVTQKYEIEDDDGEPAFDSYMKTVVMEGEE